MEEKRAGSMIDDEAADWAARIDLGALTPAETAAFEDWASSNVRHRGAYARAAAILQYARQAHAQRDETNVAGTASGNDTITAGNDDAPAPWFKRRAFLGAGAAIAASLVLGLSLDGFRGMTEYRTQTGEMQRIFLADGSVMTLNTESEAHVALRDKTRMITLVRGEASFDVAHDPERPFIVRAGQTSVRAVGTSFTVRHLADAPINVLVREGVVEVTDSDRPALRKPTRLSANMQMTAKTGATPTLVHLDEAQVVRQLAWQNGMLSFEAMPLVDANAEFNRYSPIRIVVDDPALAREPVTGRFAANDPEGFAAAVAISLGVRSEKSGNKVFIKR